MKKVTKNEIRKLIATNKEFESFLKEKRILCKYRDNLLHEAKHGIAYPYEQTKRLIQEKFPFDVIIWKSFVFSNTKEKHSYWTNLIPKPEKL